MKYLILLLLSTVLIFSQSEKNYAIEIEILTLEDLLKLQVETASKTKETVSEAPGVLNVIPKEQIKAFGWNSINSILFKQPGFFQSQDYDRTTVGFRGLFEGWNNNHLLLLIDGVPFNDNQYGTAYTWEITPLFLANSLEILRGPGSALYGSNAVNGVVNINTIKAEEINSTQTRLLIGDKGTKAFDIVTSLVNDNFTTVLAYQHYSTEGNEYDSYDNSWKEGGVVTPTKFRTNDNRSNHYVFAKVEGLNDYQGFSLQYHLQSWKYETGHGWFWMIPTIPENMIESRSIISAKYKTGEDTRFIKEFVLRYQTHNNNWNMMFSTPLAWENYYPQGMIEYLNTTTKDLFARAQITYKINEMGSTLIGGLENTFFYYSANDEQHYSNINISTGEPNNNNEMIKLGPWFEWINKKPVNTLSAYLQYSSGKILDDFAKLVIGMRYDTQFFDFYAIDKPGNPEESKSFSKLSPRVALLLFPSQDLTIKLLAGKAFRTPSPTEMFGTNTWTLAPALRTIQAEDISTYEFMMDYLINKNINLKINGYYTNFKNQTAYSIGESNQVANIYTTTNVGLEAELLFVVDKLSGFFNYSYVNRIDEEIADNQKAYIAKSDELTWAPAHLINIGLQYSINKFTASVQFKYQGEVKRRSTDNLIPIYSALRPSNVKSWSSVDIRLAYKLTELMELSLQSENILDTERFVVKNLNYPFDYKLDGRRIYAGLSFNF